MIDSVREFAIAFYRAMGDRDNTLTAIRQFLAYAAAMIGILGLMALAQWLER